MVRSLPKEVKKVYLINQDYLFGQSVQREVKNYLAKLRPDVQVVGDELIPLGKVKDFSPYITKINASGAQALLTGNWGPDMRGPRHRDLPSRRFASPTTVTGHRRFSKASNEQAPRRSAWPRSHRCTGRTAG